MPKWKEILSTELGPVWNHEICKTVWKLPRSILIVTFEPQLTEFRVSKLSNRSRKHVQWTHIKAQALAETLTIRYEARGSRLFFEVEQNNSKHSVCEAISMQRRISPKFILDHTKKALCLKNVFMVSKYKRLAVIIERQLSMFPRKKVYYEVFILTNWKRNQQCDR